VPAADGILDFIRVTDFRPDSPDGTDRIFAVDFVFEFADGAVAASAIFNRAPSDIVFTSPADGEPISSVVLSEDIDNLAAVSLVLADLAAIDQNVAGFPERGPVAFQVLGAEAAYFSIGTDLVTGRAQLRFDSLGDNVLNFAQAPAIDVHVLATDSFGATREEVIRVDLVDVPGAHVVGTNGDDNDIDRPSLLGTSEDDLLQGLRGDDVLLGGGGNDRLDGGPGRDVLTGGDDSDVYLIADGRLDQETIVEQAGERAGLADAIQITGAFATASGGAVRLGAFSSFDNVERLIIDASTGPVQFRAVSAGNATVNLDFLVDDDTLSRIAAVQGGAHDDSITINLHPTSPVTGGSIRVNGGLGDDIITVLANGLTYDANGGAGNDTISIIGGPDTEGVSAIGGSGNDTIVGSQGADLLSGGTDEDQLFGSDGDDRLSGGDGSDNLSGETGNDLLRGDRGDDTLDGGAGNDRLDGGDGADQLSGGTGDDLYIVTDGQDTIIEGPAGSPGLIITDQEIDDVFAFYGVDFFEFVDSHGAVIPAQHATDPYPVAGAALFGETWDEISSLFLAVIDGTIATDTGPNGELIVGGAPDGGIDTVRASVTFDLADAPNVENLILAGHHDLDAAGNELANRITGNDGANRIEGRGGDDILNGGGGTDTFVFSGLSGHDTVIAFDVAEDIVELGDSFANFADLMSHAGASHNNTVLTFDDGDAIVLKGIDKGSLSEANFSFPLLVF
jgi:Ca2+-binding RTX toxin-like protein